MNFADFRAQYIKDHPAPQRPGFMTFFFQRVNLIVLVISTVGAVLFSGYRTYSLMRDTPFQAIAAVAALEFGLIGVSLNRGRRRQGQETWLSEIIHHLRQAAAGINIAIIILALIVTNVVYEVEKYGVSVNAVYLNIGLVVILGGIVPFLVAVTTENMASKIPEIKNEFASTMEIWEDDFEHWQEAMLHEWETIKRRTTTAPPTTPRSSNLPKRRRASVEERRAKIENLIKSNNAVDVQGLAESFGVSVVTIRRDKKAVEESLSAGESSPEPTEFS